MMMYDGWGWGWGGWLLMTLLMIVFWAAVITAVVLAVRYLADSRHPGGAPPTSGTGTRRGPLGRTVRSRRDRR